MKLHCIREMVFALKCIMPVPDHPEPQQWYPMDYVERSDKFYAKGIKTSRLAPEQPLLAFVPIPANKPARKTVAEALVVERHKKKKKINVQVQELAYATPPDTKGLAALVQRFKTEKPLGSSKTLYVKADGNEDMSCMGKNKRMMSAMKKVRAKFGKPLIIESAYRSPAYNAKLRRRSKGVAKHSQHMKCGAIDFRVSGVSMHTLGKYVRSVPEIGGVGYYANWVHMDTGSVRSW